MHNVHLYVEILPRVRTIEFDRLLLCVSRDSKSAGPHESAQNAMATFGSFSFCVFAIVNA